MDFGETIDTNEVVPPGGYFNVQEAFCLYDTLMISPEVDNGILGWYTSYRNLAAKQRHTFFNTRNQGEVGLAYCNLETKDQMPYAFRIFSIGVGFQAPIGHTGYESELAVNEPGHGPLSDIIFAKDFMYHVGLRLRVQQNEKLLHTCVFAPDGAGAYGIGGAWSGATNLQSNTLATNGVPALENRWPFPNPIGVPKGATFSVELEFSEYGQKLLSGLCGPSIYSFKCHPDEPAISVGGASTIRVSIAGKRGVQQRGELHVG